MSEVSHHVEQMAPGKYDLGAFDCGDEKYNRWLSASAAAAVSAGTCAVYVLIEDRSNGKPRVGGLFRHQSHAGGQGRTPQFDAAWDAECGARLAVG